MDKYDILAELLLDDSFNAWVCSDGKEHAEYWQRWIKHHPDQREVLDKAKMTLIRLREKKHQLPEERKNVLRQKLIRIVNTAHAPNAGITSPTIERKKGIGWYGMAAAVFVLLTLSWLLYLFMGSRLHEVRYHTAYGEVKTIVLPDSSKVTLNGNSSIRYTYRQAEERQREVWLAGEGFFEVNPMNLPTEAGNMQAVKFIVHTDNLSIKVLGTRFNVKHRHEKTQVVLEKGSIQLDIEERDDALLMKPDELVEVKKGEKLINQKIVKANDYIAWKEGVIHFEGASFEEISSVLKDNYGIVLHFNNRKDADLINLRGSFPTQNIDILLEAIANVTHTTMKKKGKTIIYQ